MADFSVTGIAKKMVFGIIIGLIVLSFAIFGITDIFTNQSNQTVAVVGGEEISTLTYQQEYERTISRMSNERGQRISANQAKAEQIDQQVLGNMMMMQAMENYARSLGVTSSDGLVIREIKAIEAFNGIMGEFDEDTFLQMLSQSGYTRLDFEETVRKEVTREQILNTLVQGVSAPRAMAEAIIKERLESRNASYIVLAPDLAGQIEAPTDEQIEEHYQARILSFNVPETRDFTMLLIRPSDFTADIAIADEEVRELYDNRVTLYTTPEKRDVERIFGSEEDIRAALTRIEAGESFLDVGTSLGLTEEEIVLGDIEQGGIADTAVAEAAFEASEPGLIGPIQGLSWSLVRVKSISPEVIQPYEEVAAEIREALLIREAERSMGDQLDIVDEGIASGIPLEELASSIGLSTVQIKGVKRSGETHEGAKSPLLPDTPELMKEVFASTKNFDSDLIDFGESSYFVVRVDEIYPSAPKELAEVRDEVVRGWQEAQRGEKLETLAKDLIVRGNSGTSFDTLAGEVGRGVLKTPGPISRGQSTDVFSQDLVRQLFGVNIGNFFFAPVQLGESLVVMRLDEIVPADNAMVAPYTDVIKQQLDEAMVGDLRQQYIAALGELYENKTNPNAIAIATGQAPQQGF